MRVPHRHHAAVAQRPSGQQQVLAGRVDAGAVGHVRLAATHVGGQDDHRRLLEPVDELLHRCRHAGLGGAGIGAGAGAVAVLPALLGPLDPEHLAEQRLGLSGARAVAEHDEAEALPIRPRGRAAGVPHDRAQIGVGDRVGPEAPDRPGGGHALEQADGLVGHHGTYGRAMSGDDPDLLHLDRETIDHVAITPTAGCLRRRRHPSGVARAVRPVPRRHAGAGGHRHRTGARPHRSRRARLVHQRRHRTVRVLRAGDPQRAGRAARRTTRTRPGGGCW